MHDGSGDKDYVCLIRKVAIHYFEEGQWKSGQADPRVIFLLTPGMGNRELIWEDFRKKGLKLFIFTLNKDWHTLTTRCINVLIMTNRQNRTMNSDKKRNFMNQEKRVFRKTCDR
eukprot:UN26774